jgi:hypothetical protein
MWGGINSLISGFAPIAIPHRPDFKLSDLPKGVGEGLISGFAPIPHTLISN